MTTIAYKNGVMAGDRRIAGDSGQILGTVKKVWKAHGWLYGVAGDPQVIEAVRRWSGGRKRSTELPELPTGDDALGWELIVAQAPDRLFVASVTQPMGHLVRSNVYTTGSGGQFAMGAMLCGADPRRAVKIASRIDAYTGDGVDVIRL